MDLKGQGVVFFLEDRAPAARVNVHIIPRPFVMHANQVELFMGDSLLHSQAVAHRLQVLTS